MTYLDWLNDFNRWLENNNLAANSQLMYFKLLHIFNRLGWPETVQVDNLRMMFLIGAESKGTVIRARDKLIEAGFVEVQSGKKGSPNCYRLKKRSQNVTTSATANETESATANETESATANETLNKTERQKTNSPLYPPQGETGFGDDLQAAFESWIAYKTEKRQAYKPIGLKTLVGQVQRNSQEYGEAAVANLIRDCMASNWQGIIWERLRQIPAGKPQSEQPKRIYDPETGGWR